MLNVEYKCFIWMLDVSQGKNLGLFIWGKPEPVFGAVEVASRCCVGNGYPPPV